MFIFLVLPNIEMNKKELNYFIGLFLKPIFNLKDVKDIGRKVTHKDKYRYHQKLGK